MTRRNRLKQILFEIGFKTHEKKQPVNYQRLNKLGLTSHRFKDILDNRDDKEDLSIREIDAICSWLGITQEKLMVPIVEEEDKTKVKVNINFELHNATSACSV